MTGGEADAPPEAGPPPSTDRAGRMRDCSRLQDCLDAAESLLVDRLAEFLGSILGGRLKADRFSVQDRAAALGRPMVVAHLAWPRYRTRLAVGVDPPLAHAVVDRLLGFERDIAELHLQVTPVEWGILEFLVTQGLEWLEGQPGALGAWDLVLDRVGPGPFDGSGLGSIATLRWRVRLGNTIGSVRLWIPWSLLLPWLDRAAPNGDDRGARVPPDRARASPFPDHLAALATEWRIVAGTATVPVGPDGFQLRVGKTILIDDAPLTGEPTRPTGPVALRQALDPTSALCEWRGRLDPTPDGRSARLTVLDHADPVSAERASTGPAPCPTSPGEDEPGEIELVATPGPADKPCLVVEIGSLRLPLGRLAALRPGDPLDPVPGTIGPARLWASGPRCVALGDLVRVDAEIGIRIVEVGLRSIRPDSATTSDPDLDRPRLGPE